MIRVNEDFYRTKNALCGERNEGRTETKVWKNGKRDAKTKAKRERKRTTRMAKERGKNKCSRLEAASISLSVVVGYHYHLIFAFDETTPETWCR